MLIVSTEQITGKELQTLGLVIGNTIQAKNIIRDFTQALRQIVGGELKAYNDMITAARRIATDRMIEEAKKMDADAIVGVRYTTSAVAANASEIVVFGTAVKFLGDK